MNKMNKRLDLFFGTLLVVISIGGLGWALLYQENNLTLSQCQKAGADYVDDAPNQKCAWIVNGKSHMITGSGSTRTYSVKTTDTGTIPSFRKPDLNWEEMFNTERYNHFETFVKARDLKNEVATLKKKLKKAEEVKSKIVCYNFPKAVTECNCDKTPESPYPSAVCTYDERGNLRCKTDWLDKPLTPIDGRIESEYPTVAPYYYQHNTLGNDAAVFGSQKKLNYDINLLPPNGPVPEPPCEGIDAHK
jgi:hypothetical protein